MRKFLMTSLLALVGVASATAAQVQQPASLNAPSSKPAAPAPANGTLGMAQLAAFIRGYDGSLYYGAGTTGSSRLQTGIYEVDFARDVSNCFYTVTPNAVFANMIAQRRTGIANAVYIETVNTAGSYMDNDFYLNVFCSQ